MSGGEETHCERGGALGSVRVARVCRAAGLLVADGPGPLGTDSASYRPALNGLGLRHGRRSGYADPGLKALDGSDP